MNLTEEREKKRITAVLRNKADALPVVEELRTAGFAIETVADLFNKKMNYRNAIPILVEWLPRVSNLDLKEDIVRALSVKWARHAAPLLLTEFEQAEDSTGTGLRWAIGNALEVLANDEIEKGMIEFALNRSYGKAREMVVLGLGKLKSEGVINVLIKLLDDDEVVGYAVMALGKLRTKRARPRIESLYSHPKTWIRKEVKKALARIDKRGSEGVVS